MISEHWPTGCGAPPLRSITGLGGPELLYRSTVSAFLHAVMGENCSPAICYIFSIFFNGLPVVTLDRRPHVNAGCILSVTLGTCSLLLHPCD